MKVFYYNEDETLSIKVNLIDKKRKSEEWLDKKDVSDSVWHDLVKGRRVPAHRNPETGRPDAWYEAVEATSYKTTSYKILNGSFVRYETNEKTVMKAVELAKDIHRIFGNDVETLKRMESIIGYAYLQACRDWNCSWDDLGMIPSTLCILETLRRILLRVCWKSAKDAAEAQEYLDAVVSLIEKRSHDSVFSFKICNYVKNA